MKTRALALLFFAGTAHASLDCKTLDLSGTWDRSLSPRLALQGSFDTSFVNLASSQALSAHGQSHYFGKDDLGPYFEVHTMISIKITANCSLEIQPHFQRVEGIRKFSSPEEETFHRETFFKEGENTTHYQIDPTRSTQDQLFLKDQDENEVIWTRSKAN